MTLIIAHRGASGEAPENTIASFVRAVELRSDFVELDVRFSRDHKIVVMHDDAVKRTTNGRGAIGRMTLEELRKLDAGSWFDPQFEEERVPTLEEVIEVLKPTAANLLIEIKTRPFVPDGFAEAIVQTIQEHRVQSRTLVQSLDRHTVRRVKDLEPAVAAALVINSRPVECVSEAKTAGAEILAINWKLVTRGVVERAHRENLRVFVWTVDGATQRRKMLRLGVDGIITNCPAGTFLGMADGTSIRSEGEWSFWDVWYEAVAKTWRCATRIQDSLRVEK